MSRNLPAQTGRALRPLIIALCLVAVVAAIAAVKLRGKSVSGAPVERRDLLRTIVTTGRVTSLARVEVSSQVLGVVAAVTAEPGDRVSTGQVLVRLKDDEARAALQQAQAAVSELEERLNQISSVDAAVSQQRVAEAETNLRQSRSSYERVQQLYDSGISSRAELDEALRARDIAASQLEREKVLRSSNRPQGSDIKLARARLDQARAAVSGAKERLSRTVITAPGEGTLISRTVEAGDTVQAGAPLLILSRGGRTRLTAQVDEKNLGVIRTGQNVTASADAYPEKIFAAVVTTVVPAVDPQRGTVEVRCDVASPPPYLVPDMTVSLEIEVGHRKQVLTVPTEAIRDLTTTPWLLVANDGRAERRNITLGIRGNGASEVTGGVKEGEIILTSPITTAAGSRIRLQPRPITVSGTGTNAR